MTAPRRVCYVSGSRADFGLMRRTLELIAQSPRLDLGVAVTGMHLLEKYGGTVSEIERSGLAICARIPSLREETSGAEMARGVAATLTGLVDAFQRWQPDVVLLLGDRGEMLAGAVAAIHLNTPIAHIHGGERSGTVDEPVRHAISKLSHYHFVATDGARERLIRMGEVPENVFVTGAPGLDALGTEAVEPRGALCTSLRLDASRPVCIVVYHSILQEARDAGRQMTAVLDGVLAAGAQAIVMQPNADAGGDLIRTAAAAYATHPDVRLLDHMSRPRFVSWMASAAAIVGNSSAGIIEAASLGLWAINVGSRQRLRERSGNVLDVDIDSVQIAAAVAHAVERGRSCWRNAYGDGRTAERIVGLLERLPLSAVLLEKANAY